MVSSNREERERNESEGGDGIAGGEQSSKRSMTCVRGASLLKRVKKASFEGKRKIPMNFNTRGVPIGTHKSLFQQYVGYLARTQVLIGYTCWKLVPKLTKNSIYETLMNTFDIPSHEMDKKAILTNVGSKWGHFKTNLSNLTKDKKTGVYPKDPPTEYQYIDKDAWTKFVEHRSTKSFEEASRASSERSKKNIYPYKGSSQGYAGIEEKMLMSQNLDPQTHSMSRADLWKAARWCYEDGVYGDVETAQMAKRIDMYQAEESQGTLKLNGRQDVLSLALGNVDHPGRLRVVGFGVGVKRYYGSTQRSSSSTQQQVIELKAQLAKVLERVSTLEKCHKCAENEGSPIIQGKSSSPQVATPVSSPQEHQPQLSRTPIVADDCSMRGSHHVDPPEETEKCILVWPDSSCEVARGRAFISMGVSTPMLHGKKLGSNSLRVIIDKSLIDLAEVPFPTEEVPFMSENAVGNIIEWHKDKVIFEPVLVETSKGARKALFQSMDVSSETQPRPQHLAIDKFQNMISSVDDFVLKVDMPKYIVQHTHTLHVKKEYLVSWLARGELEPINISMYIKFLYLKYNPSLYKFLCPLRIAHQSRSNDDPKFDYRIRYVVASMRNAYEYMWFLPYYEGDEWALAVINPKLNTIYSFDPKREKVRAKLQEMCEAALTMLNAKRGNLSGISNPKISWKYIKCPKQPDDISCGLYVCRFMRDIVQVAHEKIQTLYSPPSPQSYNENDIYQVIEECAEFLRPIIEFELHLTSRT